MGTLIILLKISRWTIRWEVNDQVNGIHFLYFDSAGHWEVGERLHSSETRA